MLSLECASGLTPVNLDADGVQLGESVTTIGNSAIDGTAVSDASTLSTTRDRSRAG